MRRAQQRLELRQTHQTGFHVGRAGQREEDRDHRPAGNRDSEVRYIVGARRQHLHRVPAIEILLRRHARFGPAMGKRAEARRLEHHLRIDPKDSARHVGRHEQGICLRVVHLPSTASVQPECHGRSGVTMS